MEKIKDYFLNLQLFPKAFNVWIQRIVSIMAFWPNQPSYDIVVIHKKEASGYTYNQYQFNLNEMAKQYLHSFRFYKYKTIVDKYQKEGLIRSFFVTTSRGNKVFCVRIDCPRESLTFKPPINHKREGKPNDPYTIVYSHSNGCDLGVIIGSLWRMAKKCQCTVVAYDYSGYGRSTGKPSERNIYADIEAVVKELVVKHNIHINSIILYGESIGSAPTLDLASRVEVGGVILHAAIKSGFRTYFNYGNVSWIFDPFPNIDRRVNCPVLVIHGLRDNIVDITHGIALHERSIQKVRSLWLKEADHNDVRTYEPYFPRILFFFKECDRGKYFF